MFALLIFVASVRAQCTLAPAIVAGGPYSISGALTGTLSITDPTDTASPYNISLDLSGFPAFPATIHEDANGDLTVDIAIGNTILDSTDTSTPLWANDCSTTTITAVGLTFTIVGLPAAPSPPPAPYSGGGDDPCFPSDANITFANGTVARIDTIREGDSIVATTADGLLTTDTVSLLSIAMAEAFSRFLVLHTATGKSLSLTGDHHVPIGALCCSTLKKAKALRTGDTIWTVQAGAAVATTINAITAGSKPGLHSPVLTAGRFPVVDGFVTAFDSIENVRLAQYGLKSLLTACKLSGTCTSFRNMLLGDDGKKKYVALTAVP